MLRIFLEGNALTTLHYRIYGLNVATNEPLPSVAPGKRPAGRPDLRVTFGPASPVARKFPTELIPRPSASKSEGEPVVRVRQDAEGAQRFWFAYADGVEFVVDFSEKTVLASWPPHFCLEDAAVYLLGPILGFYLRLLGTISLHASVFDWNGHAIAVAGPAGGGKSTFAASLAQAGHVVLNEDVAPLRELGSGFFVLPGYPLIRLWPSSVEHLFGSREAMPQLTPSWDKRSWSQEQGGLRFGAEPLPLRAVYVLGPRERAEAPRVEALSSREALMGLVPNTYVNYLLSPAQRAQEFELLGRLVAAVPVRRLVPHEDIARLPQLRECVLRDCSALAA